MNEGQFFLWKSWEEMMYSNDNGAILLYAEWLDERGQGCLAAAYRGSVQTFTE